MSRVKDSNNPNIKKWIPRQRNVDSNFSYCLGCGINHEAIEFIRALMMCLLEQLEKKDEFFQFLRENKFVTTDINQLGDKVRIRSTLKSINSSALKASEAKNMRVTDKYFLLKKVARLNPKKPVFYVGSKNPNRFKLTTGSNIIFFKLKNKSILILASGKVEKIEFAQPEHRKPQAATDKTRIVHINECNILRNPTKLNPNLQSVFGNTFDIDLKDSIIPITHKMFNQILSKKSNFSK